MYKLIEKLYPICRSITGNEVRKTFNIIKEFIDINIKEIPSETKVFDWKIPPEWNIHDAYVKNSKGEKIIDFKKHNLHIVSYSEPVNLKLTYNEFIKNIYTLHKYIYFIHTYIYIHTRLPEVQVDDLLYSQLYFTT